MPVSTSRFEADTNVFYLTGWGHAGDHWLSKALNAHPEIFVINCYEPARLKYFDDGRGRDTRPDLLTMTAFLEDIGTDYQAIGECHAYRASQMGPIQKKYGDRVPIANLVRHPYTWLDFYIRHRVNNCRMPGTWSGALEHEWQHARHDLFKCLDLRPYTKEQVEIWAAYQGMWLLHNVLVDLDHVDYFVRIEDLLTDRQALKDLVCFLTKGRCSFSENLLDTVYAFAHQVYRGEESYVDEKTAYQRWPDWKQKAFAVLVPEEVVHAYESLGYRFAAAPPLYACMDQQPPPEEKLTAERPIMLSSMMKSGTWMMRKILSKMTGLTPHEPIHDGDCTAFEDPRYLDHPPGTFFSWHFLASPAIQRTIRNKKARLIFLYRNIGDALVSLYYHFLNEPDAALGYPTNNKEFFNHLSVEGAMIFMINGFDFPPHYWIGASLFLRQMESMIRFSEEYPVHFVSYENLVAQKEKELARLADFLGCKADDQTIRSIVDATSFEAMKEEQLATLPSTSSHFRHGAVGDHATHLTPFHHNLLKHLILSTSPELPKMLMENGLNDFYRVDDFFQLEDFRLSELYIEKAKQARQVLPRLKECAREKALPNLRVILYGMNFLAHALVELTRPMDIEIVAVSDARFFYEKIRRMFPDLRIVQPEEIATVAFDCAVVCATTGDWPRDIFHSLRKAGLSQPVILWDDAAGWILMA
ncbi:MAG: sulfotransferase domain-containing protein [Deltaproteobacteria bacterium]|nr:sulfotransferase domain-containing protein [Deltaproteobacteria bacterium]MBW1922259.1 sulfotransferase domain-containing protein [Deltaproteobacteria bacterium]MBW1949534.1 sulfotransferase domain-containing protein [Deltaproteobacteria bacterium]MBW2008415.1 sulfotransferase domain-containing protein [Deltaproteobacteria bacterium]MBW2102177.1 sulfotransferase domain-containing protein [Deltaproteobacteria bacterium]